MSETSIPMLPALLGQKLKAEEQHADRVFEAVVGLVVDNKDPDKLGRVKVRFPTLPGQDTSWWAPLSALGAGGDRGWFFLPEIDDEVLVMFEHGDMSRPIVIGALWNGVDLPPEKNEGANERRVLVSREGSRVVFDDAKGTITIEDGKKVGRIVISSDNKITLEAMKGDVTLLAPAGEVSVIAKDAKFEADNVNVSGGSGPVNLGADGTMGFSGSRLTVSAGRLDLNPGGVVGPTAQTANPEDVPDPA